MQGRLNAGFFLASANAAIPYDFRTDNKKGLGISAKSLIYLCILVGGGGFEPPTPAV